MKQTAQFKYPVFKDQTSAPNRGKIIEAADTLTLVIRNGAQAQTTQDVTVTEVGLNGKLITWNNSTTGNLRANDIVRVGREHQYQPDGPETYYIDLTESSASSVAFGVTSIALDGVVYPIGVVEAAAANGITTAFQTALAAAVNALVGSMGAYAYVSVTGTAGSQVLRLTITALERVPTAIVVTGATAGSWTEV